MKQQLGCMAILVLVLPVAAGAAGYGPSGGATNAGQADQVFLQIPRLGIKVVTTSTPGAYPATDGKIIAFHTSETAAQQDLNGDGWITEDKNDPNPPNGWMCVLQYYDIATGTVVNTMQEGVDPSVARSSNGVIAFMRDEHMGDPDHPETYTDWNGDGDFQDYLIAYYDTATGLTTDTLISGREPDIDGDRIAFHTYEGQVDLNGDGDVQDPVIRYYSISTGLLVNTMAAGVAPSISGDTIVFSTWEAYCWYSVTGATEPGVPSPPDLNGDGDTSDDILRHHMISTGMNTSTALDCLFPAIDGSFVAYGFNEQDDDGLVDDDADGDTSDHTLQAFDVNAGTWTRPMIPLSSPPTVKGTIAAFNLEEWNLGYSVFPGHGTELNANAFTGDHIVCLFDFSTQTFTSTGVAGFSNSGDSLERNIVVFADMYSGLVGYILF